MSRDTSPRPTERNWAALMDDLLNENFTVSARPRSSAQRADMPPRSARSPQSEPAPKSPSEAAPRD